MPGPRKGFIEPIQTVIEQRRASRRSELLRYPSNLGAHAVILNFKRYDYAATGGSVASIDQTKSIVLPIPTNLADSYSVNVQSQELGIGGAFVQEALTGNVEARNLGGGAVDALLGIAKKIAPGGAEDVGAGVADAASSFKVASSFFGRAGLDGLGFTGASTGVDLATGTTVNPHTTLDFNGMALKNHSFSWTFAPENEQDSNSLRRVIETIRRSILPEYTRSGSSAIGRSLITYPDLVDIFFVGLDQSYFYYFKPCMVQGFTTDFSPDGVALLRGGKPAIVNMTMQLSEAQIHTKDDMGYGLTAADIEVGE